jgi:hypothetical protein
MLPRQFNDGSDVSTELLATAVLEIGDHFGSVQANLASFGLGEADLHLL